MQISEQNIVRSYYENGYIQDYDYKYNKYLKPIKMTEKEIKDVSDLLNVLKNNNYELIICD